jgi:hypothetical protein
MRAVALGESRHRLQEFKALCCSGPAPYWGERGEARALDTKGRLDGNPMETQMKEGLCHVTRRVFYEGLTTSQRRE